MRRRTNGFTLVELLVSIALGTLIVSVAAAGVSVAARAITTSNAMALESSLLRAAVLQGCDEVDFWTMVDDPADDHAQALRATAASGGGLPFTAFAPGGFAAAPIAPAFARPGPERACAWDGSPMAWSADDPRTWCRANLIETDGSDQRFGDYSLLAFDRPQDSAPPYDPSRCRSWYDDQVEGLLNTLGFYGALEYLPSNAFLMYHGAPPDTANPSGVNVGKVPRALLEGNTWLGVKFQAFSCGRFRATDSMVIPLANPAAGLLPEYGGTQDPFRVGWRVGYGGAYLPDSLGESNRFHRATAFVHQLMPEHPSTWPDVTIKVERFIRQSRAVAICIIEVANPLTGERTTLPFSTRGTTLRGARLQRGAAGGWSTYDNRADPAHPIVGASLDCPVDTAY
jgi:prepilin-type N-terminal cleavage/methylation domain-containing protein